MTKKHNQDPRIEKLLENATEILDLTGVKTSFPKSIDTLDKLAYSLTELQGQFVSSLLGQVELKKFQLAIENASDFIVITKTDGTIIFTNKGAERVTGYTKEELMQEEFFHHAMFGKNHDHDLKSQVRLRVIEKQEELKTTKTLHKKSTDEFIAEIKIFPVVDSSKHVRHLVIIARDVTEQKKLEKAKDDFLSIASHELKTPLTAIQWNIQMLMSKDFGPLNHEQEAIIEQVDLVSKRLNDLVNMLLNTSRIEVEKVAVKPTNVNIKTITDNILKELQGQIEEKQLQVKTQFPSRIKAIPLDENLITVAINNLISNAIKYNKDKGTITLSVKPDKTQYLYTVTDTGLGIPKPQQSKIFAKMFRADNAKTSGIEGTGLGLYITKWIVESAGGEISFTSEEGKGTSFTFTIPYEGMKAQKGTRTLA